MAIQNKLNVTSVGVEYPTYPELLAEITAEYRLIYGADVDLDADTQDGQLLAIFTRALYDTMTVAAAVYSSQSPLTAQADALTRNVKINGISRIPATASTADLTCTGTAGTVIANGFALDANGNKWALPASVTIDNLAGTRFTATCQTPGAITANVSSINKIGTPTLGWTAVNNPLAATAGTQVESDAELRLRQAQSTMIPSLTVFEGVVGAVKAVPGVTDARGYENDTSGEVDGIPAHSIALVVVGGTDTDVATAIAAKKSAGCATFAAPSPAPVVVAVTDRYGETNTITFGRNAAAVCRISVSIDKIAQYDDSTDAVIQNAIADYINLIPIGDDVFISKLFTPANQSGTIQGDTYVVTAITGTLNAGPTQTVFLDIPFNGFATCLPADVTIIPV